MITDTFTEAVIIGAALFIGIIALLPAYYWRSHTHRRDDRSDAEHKA